MHSSVAYYLLVAVLIITAEKSTGPDSAVRIATLP